MTAADEGISGTSVLRREQFLAMIEKCKAGETDLIITKQVSRFARNVLDSLNYIFMLRKLDPPVGVYFEAEKLNTLDKSRDMVITVLSLVAQSKSEQKSNSLKWSFKRRRAQGLGIYPNWALLGYMFEPMAEDDYHKWVIVEDKPDVVRMVYSLYLEGYSSGQIADLLAKSDIPTVKGRDSSGVPTAYGGYQRQYLDAVHVPPIILATTAVENHHLEGNGYQTTKASLQNTTF